MDKVLLSSDQIPLLERLLDVLETERDPVKRQSGIELLTVNHAMGCPNRAASRLVADGVHKHVCQIIDQFWDYREQG